MWFHVVEGNLFNILDEFGVVRTAANASKWYDESNGRGDFENGLQECIVVCRTSVILDFDRNGCDDSMPVDYPIAVIFGQLE